MNFLWLQPSLPSNLSGQIAIHGFEHNLPSIHIVYEWAHNSISIMDDQIQLTKIWDAGEHPTSVTLSGQGFQAHLSPYPWENGAPAFQNGFNAAYIGLNGSQIRKWKKNFYAGGEGFARIYWLSDERNIRLDNGSNELRLQFNSLVGWSTQYASAELTVGEDFVNKQEIELQPHLNFKGHLLPTWTLAPWVEAYAGWGDQQDNLSKTRIGGLDPRSLPFAGAGLGEWWVEKYLLSRIGMQYSFEVKDITVQSGTHCDAIHLDNLSSISFGQRVAVQFKHWEAIAHVGYAPWLPRMEHISRFSTYLSIGKHTVATLPQ